MTQPRTRVVFLHGLEGSPDSYKIQQLRPQVASWGWDTEAPDLRGPADPRWRLAQLKSTIEKGPAFYVGSSLGGFVAATLAAEQPEAVAGLLVLCPAFDLPGYPLDRPAVTLPPERLCLIHGRQDTVVPLAASERAAAAWGCPLLVVEDDHALHHSLDAIAALLYWQLHR